jgi:hypothetical protein
LKEMMKIDHCYKKNSETLNINYVSTNLIKPTFALIAIAFMAMAFFAMPAAAETNLIVNPGFESGSTKPLNWALVTYSGNTPSWDTVSHSGARSVRIQITGTSDIVSGYPQSDLIKAQPVTSYSLSIWGKTQGAGGTNKPDVRVVELDANKNWLRQTNLPQFGWGTNDWTQKQIDFKTGSNTYYLYVYANIWKGYGTFWMDDVVLSLKNAPTPTPTSTPSPTPTPTAAPTSPPPVYTTGILSSTSVRPSINPSYPGSSGYVEVILNGNGAGTLTYYRNGVKIGSKSVTIIGSWTYTDVFGGPTIGFGTWNYSINDGTKTLTSQVTVGSSPTSTPTVTPTPTPAPIPTPTITPTPTPAPIPTPTVTPTPTPTPSGSWPNLKNKPLPGHLQWYNHPNQQDPVMAIDFITDEPFITQHRPGKIIVFGGWQPFNAFDMTDLTQVQQKFTTATKYAAYYNYASYLLNEEHWSPLILANDGAIPVSRWNTVGSATLGNSGVTVQLLDTWAKANGRSYTLSASNPTVVEWNAYYEYTLLKAWNIHMHNLGKKSSILGLAWAGCSYSLNQADSFSFTNQFKTKFFPGESSAYVIANYDLLVTYQDPQTTANVAHSVAMVKAMRDMGFNGRITHLLTVDSNEGEFSWNWNADVAYNEYKAVAPYVDYIISYPSTSFKTYANDYPAILKGFYNQYNP